jgi:hypothetical protein
MSLFDHGYALLIGVDENSVATWALPGVANDIELLRQVLVHPQRCAYPEDNIRTITGEDATQDDILDGLEWLGARIREDAEATAVIYYSGHGWRDEATVPAGFYFIPYDIDERRIRRTALRADDVAGYIADMQPRRLLVLLDCCHAGGMGVKGPALSLPGNYISAALAPGALMRDDADAVGAGAKGLSSLAQGQGRAVLSASMGTQPSYLRADNETSIFTYHLVEALTGHARPQAGAKEVLVSDVMSYVHRQVPETARTERQADQTPDFQVSGNFPVALLLGGKGLAAGQSAPPPESVWDATSPKAATPATAFNQEGQTVYGPQTNINGDVHGPVMSGQYNGPVAVGDNARAEQHQVDTGGGAYVGGNVDTGGGDFTGRDSIRITGDGNVVGDHNRVNVNRPGARVDTRTLRRKLRRLSEAGLNALCMDDFPDVYDSFGRGLQRVEKENILLDHCRRNPAEATRLERWLSENL